MVSVQLKTITAKNLCDYYALFVATTHYWRWVCKISLVQQRTHICCSCSSSKAKYAAARRPAL